MPLFIEKIEPVKQIEQIEIQPSIDKIENSSVNSWEVGFIFLVMIAIYLFRAPLLALLFFVFKFALLITLAYTTYILFIQ
jgi:hypothetical protein